MIGLQRRERRYYWEYTEIANTPTAYSYISSDIKQLSFTGIYFEFEINLINLLIIT